MDTITKNLIGIKGMSFQEFSNRYIERAIGINTLFLNFKEYKQATNNGNVLEILKRK